ncbi:hypothetical protein IWW48_003565 [Coemansia sp. RSA 1200]|nr:hypothetical protein IWW48_003565 [Coemansia sp. RSA 1200]
MFKSSAFIPANWNIGKDAAGVALILAAIIRFTSREEEEYDIAPIFHKRRHGKYALKTHKERMAREGITDPKKQNQRNHGSGSSSGGGGGGRRDYKQGHRDSSKPYVSVLDDKHGLFTKEVLERGVLLTGSHARLKVDSVVAKCPRCHNTVLTVVEWNIGRKNVAFASTVIAASILANAFIAFVPLALAALDMRRLKSKIHFCAYCGFEFGKHVTIAIPKPVAAKLHKEMNTRAATKYAKPYQM